MNRPLPTEWLLVVVALQLAGTDNVPAQARRPEVPTGVRAHHDLAYVENGHARQRLDLFVPEKAQGPVPLVLWVHGGAWRAGSKEDPTPLPLLRDGYALASINYRLSQHARFPAQIEDCKAAVRFLRANAAKYNLDADHFGAWGASAGGHLVALLGTSGGVKELGGSGGHPGVSSRVQAVCDWYGPTDFLKMGGFHDSPASPESQLVGGPIQGHPDRCKVANPITYVDKADPPFLIFHGDRDGAVPFSQSELLHQALTRAGVDSTFVPLKGAGHGGAMFESPETRGQIRAFFDRHLKPAKREPGKSRGPLPGRSGKLTERNWSSAFPGGR